MRSGDWAAPVAEKSDSAIVPSAITGVIVRRRKRSGDRKWIGANDALKFRHPSNSSDPNAAVTGSMSASVNEAVRDPPVCSPRTQIDNPVVPSGSKVPPTSAFASRCISVFKSGSRRPGLVQATFAKEYGSTPRLGTSFPGEPTRV